MDAVDYGNEEGTVERGDGCGMRMELTGLSHCMVPTERLSLQHAHPYLRWL
jgi:hypothetical protein